MKRLKNVLALAAGAVLLTPIAAAADDTAGGSARASHDGYLASDTGISVAIGGGISGFTSKTMRNAVTSDVEGLWGVRTTFGSHLPLAFDINYAGTAAHINSLISSKRGTLVGTTLEAAVRYNVLPHAAWNPYLFAGMGWQRYDVTGADMHLWDSGIAGSDDSAVFPLGAGISYRDRSGLVADFHGTFRLNVNNSLVLEDAATSRYAPMHTWEASAAIGYEF